MENVSENTICPGFLGQPHCMCAVDNPPNKSESCGRIKPAVPTQESLQALPFTGQPALRQELPPAWKPWTNAANPQIKKDLGKFPSSALQRTLRSTKENRGARHLELLKGNDPVC